MNRFFVDAETDGLYGSFLSIAALVTDESGRELDRFYMSIKRENRQVNNPWVIENVLPYLDLAEDFAGDENELLDRFWDFWILHRENVICIAHVQYPVEARLFTACVMKEREKREFLGPFPLYDLSTLLAARGFDSDTDTAQLSGLKLPLHDAMNDVRIMAKVWHDLEAGL